MAALAIRITNTLASFLNDIEILSRKAAVGRAHHTIRLDMTNRRTMGGEKRTGGTYAGWPLIDSSSA
jgi:hypothetical protein